MARFDQLAGKGTGPVHSELDLLGIYLMVICPKVGVVSKVNGQMLRRTSPSSLVELETLRLEVGAGDQTLCARWQAIGER